MFTANNSDGKMHQSLTGPAHWCASGKASFPLLFEVVVVCVGFLHDSVEDDALLK